MSIEKSYLTSYPKCKFWSLQKMGVLMLSFLPLSTYASDNDTLLLFSMQVGSIIYVSVIVSLFVRNANVRMMLFALYLSLTVSAYLFTLNPVCESDLLLTIFTRSIIPFLSTIVLAIVILVKTWRKI